MGRQDTTTIRFDCDWRCGAHVELTNPRDLNHAHVPKGWERIALMWSSVMTTSEHEGTPYMLCPNCFTLWKLCVEGTSTPMGIRFRSLVTQFTDAEKAFQNRANPVRSEVTMTDDDDDPSEWDLS